MRSTAPKKILVVRFSSIGDIVLTFPVVSAIKSLFPECQVDFATKKQFATLLEACPQIDQVFLLQDSLTALRQQIDFKHYDAIFDLHHNLRTRLLLFASRVPVYRFPKNNIEKWLLTSFKVVPKQRKHVIERYLEPLRQIAPSFAPFHAKLEYIIPKEAQFDISKRFELQSKTYIAVAIGAQFATKRLPTDLLINLIGQLESPVLLLGGKEDTSTAQLILQNTATQKVYSAVGQTNIVIWGNTVKDFGMYPYRLEQEDVFHYEVADLACRPCSKIGHEQCPKGHFACMRKQDLSQIASRLRRTTF